MNRKTFALVDCNNFYASCERVFNPALKHKPVVVLSNNDGCAIARSNEAKALGIAMGAPFFSFKHLIKQGQVHVCSSNFALYGDMSWRVSQALKHMCPTLEVYSIDESFLDLSDIPPDQLLSHLHLIRQTVFLWTGIPVSIGVGHTKTLAKVANNYAKKNPGCHGVFSLAHCEWDRVRVYLNQLDVGDVWGVGRRHCARLKAKGIETALDFVGMEPREVRQQMGVIGQRTHQELHNHACFDLELLPEPQKNLAVTRSFREEITDFDKLSEAVSAFAERAGEKMRKKGLTCEAVQIYCRTNPFNKSKSYYSNTHVVSLESATSFTPKLIRAALQGLSCVFREGFSYKKAGVMLLGLRSADEATQSQQSLFNFNEDSGKRKSLMRAVDALNKRYGKQTLSYGSVGKSKACQSVRKLISPRYTTSWQEILKVN